MSWCAGFAPAFWAAYFEVAPKAPLFEARRDVYTLYHILNVRPGITAAAARLPCPPVRLSAPSSPIPALGLTLLALSNTPAMRAIPPPPPPQSPPPLQHANLFGGGYHSQAEAILKRLNAALEKGAH